MSQCLAAFQTVISEANVAASQARSIHTFRIPPSAVMAANGMLTPSWKVQRTVVAKEYADEIAALYD